MTDSREQALMIKGYLMASNAPAPLLAGIEMILNDLQPAQATINARIPLNNVGDIVAGLISRRAPKPVVRENRVTEPDHIPDVTKMVKAPATADDDHIADADKMIEGDHSANAGKPIKADVLNPSISIGLENHPEREHSGEKAVETPEIIPNGNIPVKKPRKEWSPEAKAAAAERMRARIAAGKMKRKGDESTPVTTIKNSEYVGERSDKTLADADWGDIQKMRYNGLPDVRIAKHYGVDLDYLQRFIERMEKRDEANAGNF